MAVPTDLFAGDTWTFTLSGGDTPADDGWVAQLKLQHPTFDAITMVATADGADFKFAATPLDPNAGRWQWQAVATKTGQGRKTIGAGVLTIHPDLFDDDTDNFDGRTDNEKILEAVTATLTGNANLQQQTTSVDGVSVVNRSMQELTEMRRYYTRLVRQEREAADRANGKSTPRVRLRFSAH